MAMESTLHWVRSLDAPAEALKPIRGDPSPTPVPLTPPPPFRPREFPKLMSAAGLVPVSVAESCGLCPPHVVAGRVSRIGYDLRNPGADVAHTDGEFVAFA